MLDSAFVFIAIEVEDAPKRKVVLDAIRALEAQGHSLRIRFNPESPETGQPSKYIRERSPENASLFICFAAPKTNSRTAAELEWLQASPHHPKIWFFQNTQNVTAPAVLQTDLPVNVVRYSGDEALYSTVLAQITVWADNSVRQLSAPPTPTFLPEPFAWCLITPGMVNLESGAFEGDPDAKKWIVHQRQIAVVHHRFWISQTPITNAQYRAFIQEPDGYADNDWWDFAPDALNWRNDTPLTALPISEFSGDTRPRTDLTWYEAVAFCRWVSHRLPFNVIRLPTAVEWQRAALGDRTTTYPWGNEGETERANVGKKLNRTTPVLQYPLGISQFEVFDMAGNVWEWVASPPDHPGEYATQNAERYSIKGGSWYHLAEYARAAAALSSPPYRSLNTIGFRIAAFPQDAS